MIEMFVRHENVIRFWESSIVNSEVAEFVNRVDFDFFSVKFNADAGVD